MILILYGNVKWNSYKKIIQKNIGKFIKENHKPLISLQGLINSSKIKLPSHLPPMSAGLIGYLGYETIELYEKLPKKKIVLMFLMVSLLDLKRSLSLRY